MIRSRKNIATTISYYHNGEYSCSKQLEKVKYVQQAINNAWKTIDSDKIGHTIIVKIQEENGKEIHSFKVTRV